MDPVLWQQRSKNSVSDFDQAVASVAGAAMDACQEGQMGFAVAEAWSLLMLSCPARG